ncbi:MAG: endonuclease [Cyclobacteriaceae bacterium]|nr:MAG: endonuclease [Cyclobacteriaceae bacterium]
MMIPVILILNTFLMIYLIFKASGLFIYPTLVCFFGLLFLTRTVAFNEHEVVDGLKVLSYNVRVFNVYSHLNSDFVQSKHTIDWVTERDDDIKCLQEFYVKPGDKIFSTVKSISKKNPYYHFEPTFTNSDGAQFGMAIFSKYPIINRGSIHVNAHSNNSILFADIVRKKDTVRVYNVHLESMSIDEQQLANSNTENFSTNLQKLLSQLKHGFVQRAMQIDNLCGHLERSPYPIILTGDLNDMPYSYSYQKLKKYLHSSFENGGSGFGFTFNGRLFFLRIDNQFYSEGVNLGSFITHREVKHSDHFPISAIYSME